MRQTGAVILILCAAMISPLVARGDSAPATPAARAYQEYVPPELRDVGIDEKPGAVLPLDLQFVDHTGKAVSLRDYFDGTKPVILQLGYFECPQLCGMVSQGLADALKEQTLRLGEDYRVIYLSFDPNESFRLAEEKRQNLLIAAGKDVGSPGLHLLTGSRGSIDQLTSAVGFKYKWVPDQQLYSHSAAIMICSPEGKLSRYLFGVKFDAQKVRLALVEASAGKIGTAEDQYLLTCLPFGGNAQKHSKAARLLMQSGGVVTVALLCFMIVRTYRQTRAQVAAESATSTQPGATERKGT